MNTAEHPVDSEHSATRQYALPLVVAVTGHRDLVAEELPAIRSRVRELLQELLEKYPHNQLTVMSPLAEGADMLVGEIAVDMGLDLIVPLPKSREDYFEDFNTAAGQDQFEKLCSQAKMVLELSCEVPPAPAGFDPTNWRISYPYAHLGTFLCAHCHILLAIWDGKDSDKMGGTAQVVRFHQDDVMLGMTSKTAESQQMLVDDESDLVFHIVCSRSEPGFEPHPNLKPLDWSWYTKDPDQPRSRELPAQHELVFQRSTEFSADAVRYSERIEKEKWSLLYDDEFTGFPEGIADINNLYCIADWLAMHFQKLTLRTLMVTHLMAFLMGLMFILYTDLDSVQGLLLLFLVFFGIAFANQIVAKRLAWHRKYLDYRTLAEGLRVQFYWAAAGVSNESRWKFTHDNYLQSQNPEFGWIRNVMRVAGIQCDATPHSDPAGLAFTLEEWVGGPDRGQLGYFRRKAGERLKRQQNFERMGQVSLLISVLTVFIFILFGAGLSDLAGNLLTVVMGSALLIYAVWEGYTYATATKELIKQYEHMLRIFDNAHRRLVEAHDAQEQRLILAALGQSALDEHSDWILMQRDRSLDESEIWRMSS